MHSGFSLSHQHLPIYSSSRYCLPILHRLHFLDFSSWIEHSACSPRQIPVISILRIVSTGHPDDHQLGHCRLPLMDSTLLCQDMRDQLDQHLSVTNQIDLPSCQTSDRE